MACYDCEDCDLHIEHGGKCRRFEYDCPFDLYQSLDKFPVEAAEIVFLLNEIKRADKRIQEIVDKTHSYGIRVLDNLHWAVSRLDDDIASAEEWAEINKEE